jgi:hypothetical protein
MLRVQRAGEEASIAAKTDHHRMTERADLVRRLNGEIAAAQLSPFLVHQVPQRSVEVPQ